MTMTAISNLIYFLLVIHVDFDKIYDRIVTKKVYECKKKEKIEKEEKKKENKQTKKRKRKQKKIKGKRVSILS